MKKIPVLVVLLLVMAFSSCKNADKKGPDERGTKSGDTDSLQIKAESLYNEVLKGHDQSMGGWMHIEGLQKKARQMLDSIAALPAKAQTAAASLKTKLTELLSNLQSAYDAMDKWMNEINLDSAKNNLELRIKYFSDEKLKIDKVKDDISNSLKQADSVLSSKH